MKYEKLVSLYEKLFSTTKRLLKTYYLSEFLRSEDLEDVNALINLIRGKVFSDTEEEKLGISARLILKAIVKATGKNLAQVEQEWKKTGDLGLTAHNLVETKTQVTLFSQELSIKKVYDNLRKLPSIEGHGSVDKKMSLLAELLTSAKPLEAKYIVRTVLEEMRIGIGDGSIRDSFLWAWFKDEIGLDYNEEKNDLLFDEKERENYNDYSALIQRAYDLTNDFGRVAMLCMKGKSALQEVKLALNTPLKVMLCQKVSGIKEGFESIREELKLLKQ